MTSGDGPSPAIFLTAEWRHLVMLNYQVNPALLRQFVPLGTELDDWHGQTFVSLVGFRFLKTKVRDIPIPFHRNFEEVNLRFYVRRREGAHVKRGVVFIREIVPRALIAAVARFVYNERYVALPMTHQISAHGSARAVEYAWQFEGLTNRIRLTASGEPVLPETGSQEQFITEHYWGYTCFRGGCSEYRVEHPRWKIWNAEKFEFSADVATLYGEQFVEMLRAAPRSAFIADGSPIEVLLREQLA